MSFCKYKSYSVSDFYLSILYEKHLLLWLLIVDFQIQSDSQKLVCCQLNLSKSSKDVTRFLLRSGYKTDNVDNWIHFQGLFLYNAQVALCCIILWKTVLCDQLSKANLGKFSDTQRLTLPILPVCRLLDWEICRRIQRIQQADWFWLLLLSPGALFRFQEISLKKSDSS